MCVILIFRIATSLELEKLISILLCINRVDLRLRRRSFTANRDILPLFFGIIISLAFLMPFSSVSFLHLSLPPLPLHFFAAASFSNGIKIKLIYIAKKKSFRLPFENVFVK